MLRLEACPDCGAPRGDRPRAICNPCNAARTRARYASDPRKIEYMREWSRKNPEKRSQYRRRAMLKSFYGMTIEQYEAMLEAQDGRCAICGNGADKSGKNVLYVDHCHDSGAIRELLCSRCNFAIGQADDRPEILEAMAGYLRRHQRPVVIEGGI